MPLQAEHNVRLRAKTLLDLSGSLSRGTNTHGRTTLSLTCVPPASLCEARARAWPSAVCPIVCFMQEGKSDVIVRNSERSEQEVHLRRTVTERAPHMYTKTHAHTHDAAGTAASPTKRDQKQATRRFTLPTTDGHTDTQ